MDPLQQIHPSPHRPPPANDEAAVVARRGPSAATDGGAAAAPGAGFARAMYGATIHELPIAGLTVGEAYAQVREMMHMPESVIAVIDGRPANVHERIASGSTLEFVKRSGEKGVLFS
jgi:hypothetical protein